MENADAGLRPKLLVDRSQDAVQIGDEHRDVVLTDRPERVPAVVADVVEDQVELVNQERPERIVQVDRHAIAMA